MIFFTKCFQPDDKHIILQLHVTVKNVNLFLPSKIVVCEAPETMDIRKLIDDPRYDLIEESALDAGRVAGTTGSDGYGFVRACYATAIRSRSSAAMSESSLSPTSGVYPRCFISL